MTTLVLVLASHVWPYPALVRTIKKTWASVPMDRIETLFYFGGPALKRRGRELDLPVPDDLAHVAEKTLACFEYALANLDFDLVFRTNCSSYVDLPNLQAFVDRNADPRRFYCGTVQPHGSIPFASGAGYFLSRDLVELAVDRKAEWNLALLDDVALGEVMQRHDVQVRPAPRREYAGSADLDDIDASQFHFRCKTISRSRIDDAAAMVELHRAFWSSRGSPPRSPFLATVDLAGKALALSRRARSLAALRAGRELDD